MKIRFSDYNLKEYTYKFINENQFKEPTQIQAKVIPLAIKGKDVIGISDTGTGKTHAFLIPIMNQINVEKDQVQAIITAPTRELALQLYLRAKQMEDVLEGVRIKLITGGKDKQKMSQELKRQPHIVIGTPGRMRDLFLDDQSLHLYTAKMMVIDEADMTMEYGFLEDIDQICARMKKIQMLSFSATIPEPLRLFLKKYMYMPELVEIKEDRKFKPQIEHILIPCKQHSYEEMILQLLPTFNPYVCLIFANTRSMCAQIANTLRDAGIGVIELHGDRSSRERRNAMRDLQTLKERYIVASDIAARGIDIEGVSHVISAGFPNELEFYIHRSGRTGRAGKTGICYALYKENDLGNIKQLQDKGIGFTHKKIVGNELQELKPIFYKRLRKDDELEKEISKIVHQKKVKVKPGYKKKQKDQVEKLKRKAKRNVIQADIKKQAKEKAKAKQRAKRGEE